MHETPLVGVLIVTEAQSDRLSNAFITCYPTATLPFVAVVQMGFAAINNVSAQGASSRNRGSRKNRVTIECLSEPQIIPFF